MSTIKSSINPALVESSYSLSFKSRSVTISKPIISLKIALLTFKSRALSTAREKYSSQLRIAKSCKAEK